MSIRNYNMAPTCMHNYCTSTANRPSDCGELDKIFCTSGIYTIYPDDTDGFDVFCEMEKDGGGWTVSFCLVLIFINFISTIC